MSLQTEPKRTAVTSPIEAFGRWARLKKYRIEVTYGVYVFTPGEKLVFWAIFSLILGLGGYYVTLFLSQNVSLVIDAAWSLICMICSSSSSGTGRSGGVARLTAGLASQPAGGSSSLAGYAPSGSA